MICKALFADIINRTRKRYNPKPQRSKSSIGREMYNRGVLQLQHSCFMAENCAYNVESSIFILVASYLWTALIHGEIFSKVKIEACLNALTTSAVYT